MSGRVLVTGANGFIGRRTVRLLRDQGWTTVAMVLPDEAIHPELDADEVARANVTDRSSLDAPMRDVDAVVHLAALVAEASGDYPAHWAVTADGSANVFDAAGQVGARTVVTTSICNYGDAVRRGPCPEDVERGRPQGPYGVAKQGQEDAAFAAASDGLDVSVVRPSNVYGIGSRPWVDLMVGLLQAGQFPLLDGGTGNAGLVHVDNLADALVALLGLDDAAGQAFNVCDGLDVTWAQYAHDLAEIVGAAPPQTVDAAPLLAAAEANEDPPNRVPPRGAAVPPLEFLNLIGADSDFPTDRLVAATGWAPRVSYDQAIEELRVHLTS